MKNIRFCCALALIAASLLLAQPAFCWDKVGHMIVSQIAYDHLTPKARQEVNRLVLLMNKDPLASGVTAIYNPYNAVTASVWMDDLKDQTKVFNSWHFIDLPDGIVTKQDVVRSSNADPRPNVYKAITQTCENVLTDPNAPSYDKARMLGFLLHLVGDIHQPLHCTARQRGGNDYKITPIASADPTWAVSNLHAFWDNAYRYDKIYNFTALVFAGLDLPRPKTPGRGGIKVLADVITKKYLTKDRSLLNERDPAAWALESYQIAASFSFPPDNAATLSANYVHKAHDIACRRIALAGYRLANLLNQIYK